MWTHFLIIICLLLLFYIFISCEWLCVTCGSISWRICFFWRQLVPTGRVLVGRLHTNFILNLIPPSSGWHQPTAGLRPRTFSHPQRELASASSVMTRFWTESNNVKVSPVWSILPDSGTGFLFPVSLRFFVFSFNFLPLAIDLGSNWLNYLR